MVKQITNSKLACARALNGRDRDVRNSVESDRTGVTDCKFGEPEQGPIIFVMKVICKNNNTVCYHDN